VTNDTYVLYCEEKANIAFFSANNLDIEEIALLLLDLED